MADFTLASIKQIHKNLLKEFDCGIPELNEYLSRYALKNDTLGIGKTFVALDSDQNILGYFTLANAQIKFQEIPDDFRNKLPRYPIPALRIARLAVNKTSQGKGAGKWLLTQAFRKIIQVSEITGLYFIIVDAKETSKSFYEHYGFIKLEDSELSYFLPVETVRKAMYEGK